MAKCSIKKSLIEDAREFQDRIDEHGWEDTPIRLRMLSSNLVESILGDKACDTDGSLSGVRGVRRKRRKARR